jgi:hypothetical protein
VDIEMLADKMYKMTISDLLIRATLANQSQGQELQHEVGYVHYRRHLSDLRDCNIMPCTWSLVHLDALKSYNTPGGSRHMSTQLLTRGMPMTGLKYMLEISEGKGTV